MKKFPSGSGPPATDREWKAYLILIGVVFVGGYICVSAWYDKILHPIRAGPNDLVCLITIVVVVKIFNRLHEWVVSKPPELLYPRNKEPP